MPKAPFRHTLEGVEKAATEQKATAEALTKDKEEASEKIKAQMPRNTVAWTH